MELKCCTVCKQLLPVDQFYLASYRHKDGTQSLLSRCKTCTYEMTKKWLKKNESILKQKHKEWHQNRIKADPQMNAKRRLKARLKQCGKTLDWYYEQLEKQEHVCGICKRPETTASTAIHADPKKRLAVDHCHKGMHARGLLCMSCNTKLAVLEDERFVNAAKAYLAKYQP